MIPPEVVLAIAAAQVPPLEFSGGGGSVDAENLAAYLAGIPDRCLSAAMLDGALDPGQRSAVLAVLLADWARYVAANHPGLNRPPGWPKGLARDMAELVILETLHPAKVRSEEIRAGFLGLNLGDWRTKYRAAYEAHFWLPHRRRVDACHAAILHNQREAG